MHGVTVWSEWEGAEDGVLVPHRYRGDLERTVSEGGRRTYPEKYKENHPLSPNRRRTARSSCPHRAAPHGRTNHGRGQRPERG